MTTAASVIADSVSDKGHRVTTFEITMHRFVLAELNTHRVFSRNSASSRAIPVTKQIERIQTHPAIPVAWPAEQAGMQGGEALSPGEKKEAEDVWIEAAEDAVLFAQHLIDIGVHKSVTNRILEPYMWHTVIITASAYDNFFALRCNKMAQPEIKLVAELMKDAYDNSEPEKLSEGEWHLPYLSDEEFNALDEWQAVRVSAARCARVSYLTHDGVRSIEKDIELYERLTGADPMHSSPLEHVACPMPSNAHKVNIFRNGKNLELTLPKYGNLLGWHQLRFDVEIAKQYRAFA